MDLETVVRQLVTQAQEDDLRLSLSHVARKVKVDYKRLWAFMQEENPGRITGAEAQQIYEILTGKPLITSEDHAI